MTVRVYIGLGSNLGKPLQQIESAILELQALAVGSTMDISPCYETKPVGPQDQPDFINAVVSFYTELDANVLLDQLFVIEDKHNRQRQNEQWGPRTLDLDLLLYGDEVIASERLTVPHPRMHERAFVLQPLLQIAPECQIPGRGLVSALIKQCDVSGIRDCNA
jgi:2-amino-4-hydroxy-6-hydroxymethyldihydropteridine diphosphokinase